MLEDIPIKISADESLGGKQPLVILGPNGSGKTRYGAELANLNGADLIGALRNIQLNEHIGMRALDQADQELRNLLKRRRSRYWEMSSEIDQLFSKLLSEDSQAAIRYRNAAKKGESVELEQTKLMTLRALWTKLFPGRTIEFDSYSPRVKAIHSGTEAEYLAQQMSDGERVALYLAARVLDSERSIIIIDEPEVHFHNRLAVSFWDKLEELRDDCRFVYITHDLAFALSRQTAQFLVIQPKKQPELVPIDSQLPSSIVHSLLSAASLSIYARRVVFCEGDNKLENKRDYSFYSSWFNELDTVVMPVGNSEEVIQCTVAFGNSQLISGVVSVGVIDRDYWPDKYFAVLPEGVHVLPVHELENLYCLRGVFSAIGKHLGRTEAQIDNKYSEFLLNASRQFRGGLFCKQVSERFKKRYELDFLPVLNALEMSDDLQKLQVKYSDALRNLHTQLDPDGVFQEESKRITDALNSDEEHLLKVLPGKNLLAAASNALGLKSEAYIDMVHSSLEADEDSELHCVGQLIEQALRDLLPPRKIGGSFA